MSRYSLAVDLASWRDGQRSRKRRRKGGRGKGARRAGGPGGGGGRAPKAPQRQHDLEPAEELKHRGKHPDGPRGKAPRGRDAMRGDDNEVVLHEAELAEGELEPADLGEEDLGEAAAEPGGRRKVKDRVHDAVSRDWQKPQALGERMRVQTKSGTRAAIIEVKPGLFVVAEVPVESVEFGFGPMLLAPALIKTLGRALQGRRSAGGAGRAHRPELSTVAAPKQLPGPTADQEELEGRLAPWLDQDIAEELGCPCERVPKRRTP